MQVCSSRYDLTNKRQTRLGQVRPLKDGVEDVLSFTVQLIHLIQNQKPEEEPKQKSETLH